MTQRASRAGADRRPARGASMIAAAACAWGTWSLFFRPAEARGGVSPALEAFVVFGVIFLVTLPLALRERRAGRRPFGVWVLVGLAGVFDAMNALLFFWAMQQTSLAVAVLSHYLAPVLVALAAPFVVAERMTARAWLGLALALGGLCLLLEPWHAAGPGVMVGAALGAGSAFFFAASLLTAKRLGAHLAPTEILCFHMPTALLTLGFFLPASPLSAPPAALGLLVLGGLGPGAIAGVLFIRGLASVEASRASILMLLEPVVAVLVGVVFFAELPRPLGLVGAGMVLLATQLVLAAGRPADGRS